MMNRLQPICRSAIGRLMAKRAFGNRSLVSDGFYRSGSMVSDLLHRVGQMERDFDRLFFRGFRPFMAEHPTSTELFRLKNPIVEEDGVKKFKLQFDVRRFHPEDVKISTDAKDNTLTIEAKFEDEDSKFEYQRKITIPEGVKPNELTCVFKNDGVLTLEAPYVAPPEKEPPKDTPIEISHK